MLLRGEVDGVLFGCQKPASISFNASVEKTLNVVQIVSMVIAKADFCRGCDSGRAHLNKKLFWPRDAAEDNRRGRHVRKNELTLDSPDRHLQQGAAGDAASRVSTGRRF